MSAVDELCASPEWKAMVKLRLKTINYLVGQTLKKMPTANPQIVREIVQKRIDAI